jgi:hypothetical protein
MSKKIDYLTSDPEIPGQKWACLSFLTPELIKNCDIRSVKVRGCYSTEAEAKNRCEELQRIDGLHNVYVAPVGHWLPWCDDPEKATDFEYAEGELNKLMKAYKKNQESAKMLHEQRKTDLVNESINQVNKKKEEILTDEVKLDNKDILVIDNKDIENDKVEFNELKESLDKETNNLNNITDELEQAENLYKEMLSRQNKENI